jgi:hypothetical protein
MAETKHPRLVGKLPLVLLGAACALALASCKGGNRKKSEAAQWIDSPSSGVKEGRVIKFPTLGVKFEVPEVLYVYKNCGEASHSPEGDHKWVPVITCSSAGGGDVFGGGEESEEDDGSGLSDDSEDGGSAEEIGVTFYVTHKTRPLDERSVSWFENQYKSSGLSVDEISFQHDFQKKSGIYAKLHIVDRETNHPTREIIQFMFPRDDVVFIARMEYPFGESRSVDQDWKYLLWNFNHMAAAAE